MEQDNVGVITASYEVMRPQQQHRKSIQKMRYITSSVILVLRMLLPMCFAVYYTWLRNQRKLMNGVRSQLLPSILATLSNSISGTVLSPSSKLDPLFRTFRVRPQLVNSEPEKCVKCDVLYDPSPIPIRADVIFIHGLHGSLEKTWKQGIWDVKKVRTVPVRRRNSQPAQMTNGTCKPRLNRSRSVAVGKERHEQLLGLKRLLRLVFWLTDWLTCVIERLAILQVLPEEDEQDNNNEREQYSKCWPQDWLPQDCPGVRVIALNYTTDPFLWRPLWITKRNRTCMLQRSREMMDHLKKLGVGNYPIIWVGHSKGGLFVKQMIVDAFETGYEKLCFNTRGIMFYSVPHRGSPCADFNLPLLRQSVELTEVQKDCHKVLELHSQFLSLINAKHLQVEIYSFIETVQTFMTFLHIQIVSLESADLGIGEICGAPLDHRNICKPSSRQCFLYRELASLINRTV